MTKETLNTILFITPLVIGGIIAAINAESANLTIENAVAWTRKTQTKTSIKKDWFSRLIANPILWIIVRLSDSTEDFSNRGIKNGMRIAATLYIIAAWCYILYTALIIAVVIVIAGVILYVVFKVLINSNEDIKRGFEKGQGVLNSNTQGKQEDVNDFSGLKGKKIYSGTNWFNEELKGRVDDEGNIYKGTNWFNEEKIGRIDEDGNILAGTSFLNETKVGRIDEDGNLHKGTNWFNEEKTGRIDEDGNIHKGTNWFNEEKTGRTGD